MMSTLTPFLYPKFHMLLTPTNTFSYKYPHYSYLKSHKSHPSFRVYVQNGNNGIDTKDEEQKQNEPIINDNGNDNNPKKERWVGFDFRWNDLLNPDPDNFVAIGLAGVLTWASVQVLWQLLFISFAIVVAALKYSFIAALLIFILITLL